MQNPRTVRGPSSFANIRLRTRVITLGIAVAIGVWGMWRRFNFLASSHLASDIAHKCYGRAQSRHRVTGRYTIFRR